MKLLCLISLVVFLAVVTAKDPEEPPEEFQCRILYEYKALRGKKGNVTSPYYDKKDEYHNNLWCEYRIRAPRRFRIKLTFKVMDIVPSGGCAQDRLVVYGKDKDTLLGIFCGTELPNPIVSNEGEAELRLLFQSDFMASGKGFVVEYEASPDMKLCADGLTACRNRNCYDESKKCDGVDDCGDGTDEEDCGFPIVTEPDDCGRTPIPPKTILDSPDRMVGGEIAIPNSWPWQVSLQTSFSEPNGHFCGGTLINAQWVITAGHCVAGFTYPEDVKLHIGSHHKFTRTKYEQVRIASKIITYPDLQYDRLRSYSFVHDLTLVKLNAPVKFNDGVQPACLPKLGWKLDEGTVCYVSGWGETRGSGGSDELKQMEQNIYNPQNCSSNVDTQICIGKLNKNPCHGDSGGPLSCKLDKTWYVFGAASYVTTTNMISGLCTAEGSKTVYADIADKIDWVKTLVKKYS